MKRLVTEITSAIVGCMFLLILVEGTLNWIHTLRTIQVRMTTARPWISKHLEFDALLGWISKPNLTIPDMFGPGKGLTTDENRLRKTQGFATKQTINGICAGDSFTFGFGVDDMETWCSMLSTNNWKTYNMGQDAYGLDQIYLRYERDGQTIPHTFLITAIIGDDLERMTSPSFFESFDKPILQLQQGKLINTNYPIKLKPTWKTIVTEIRAGLGELRTYITIQKIFQQFNRQIPAGLTQQNRQVITAILHQMNLLSRKRGAQFILVLLPTYPLQNTKSTVLATYESNRMFLQKIADQEGFLFIDVGTSIYQSDPDTLSSYFIQPDDFHNTKAGHEVIAKTIRMKIESIINSNGTDR